MSDNLHHLRPPAPTSQSELEEVRQAISALVEEILAIRNEINKLTRRDG